MSKIDELRNKTAHELKDELLALMKEQFNLRMLNGMGEAPKTHLFRLVRRKIACIRTLLRERELQL